MFEIEERGGERVVKESERRVSFEESQFPVFRV
jgi:hypothetical protein